MQLCRDECVFGRDKLLAVLLQFQCFYNFMIHKQKLTLFYISCEGESKLLVCLYFKNFNTFIFLFREKKLSRNGSLKVLNHAMSGPDGRDNCNKFVDILGLRTIFPLFMKTPKKNRKRVLTTEEHEGIV